MAGGHCTGRDIRIWAWVIGNDEVVVIVGGEKFILHHESKFSFLFTTIGAGDHQCNLVGLLSNFLHAGVCRFAIMWGEFGECKTAVEGIGVDHVHGWCQFWALG